MKFLVLPLRSEDKPFNQKSVMVHRMRNKDWEDSRKKEIIKIGEHEYASPEIGVLDFWLFDVTTHINRQKKSYLKSNRFIAVFK